jgi:hypothetical protein
LNGTAAGISKTLTCARQRHFGGRWRKADEYFD